MSDNVFIPPRVKATDVKAQGTEVPEDVKSLQQEVTKMGLHRQLVTEQRMTDQILNPPMQEPPVKITGDINLGSFNLQEQQKLAAQEAAMAKKDAEDRIEKVRAELTSTQSMLHTAQLDNVKQGLEMKISMLMDALQKGQAQQPDFLQQLATIEAMAEKLGFSKGQGGDASMSFTAQVELKKLEAEMRREERKFTLEMERDKREWQLELRKLDAQNKQEEAKRLADENKWKQFAAFPEQIGMAFARGIQARQEQGLPIGAQGPVALPNGIIETDEGGWGEIPCDRCQTLVGVGPTATQTACAKCHRIFDIRRLPPEDGKITQPVPGTETLQEPQTQWY